MLSRPVVFDIDYEPNMLVTIMEGPYKDPPKPSFGFGLPAADLEPVEDKTYHGHVFRLAAWMPPFMQLAPLQPAALIEQPHTRSSLHQLGSLAAVIAPATEGPQHVATALLFRDTEIKITQVTEEYAAAYVRHWAVKDDEQRQLPKRSSAVTQLLAASKACTEADNGA